MALNASKVESPAGSSSFNPIEPDTYLARLVQVIDLGLQAQRPYQGQEKPPAHMVMLTYELVTEFQKDEDGNDIEDKPRWISEDMPLHNLSQERAKSTKRIQAIDPKMQFDGDLTQMVGMGCAVTVVQNQSKKDPSKVYTNVGNVAPSMKGVPIPELINSPKVFDLDEPDLEIFGSFPEWVQDKIKGNLNFEGSALQQLLAGGDAPQAQADGGEEDDDDSLY